MITLATHPTPPTPPKNSMFKRASKSDSLLRLAIFGPSGAGKTMSALRIATGIGGRIAFIDTERGSASKYADRFTFDTVSLTARTINDYVAAIMEAAKLEYPVLIIDSLSHAWQELLAEMERVAKVRYKGNIWSAWSEGTPRQRLLTDTMLSYPGHVIATIRSKTEWAVDSTASGKTKPVRVGLAPEQGKGLEYEFDVLLEISADHMAQVLKDRTGQLQDRILDRPDEEFGKLLVQFLCGGDGGDSNGSEKAANGPPAEMVESPAPENPKKAVYVPTRALTSIMRAAAAITGNTVGTEDLLRLATHLLGRSISSLEILPREEHVQLYQWLRTDPESAKSVLLATG